MRSCRGFAYVPNHPQPTRSGSTDHEFGSAAYIARSWHPAKRYRYENYIVVFLVFLTISGIAQTVEAVAQHRAACAKRCGYIIHPGGQGPVLRTSPQLRA